ncbi:MAG: hypothetical protein AAB436_01890 [Patescibacteria group bacterium]
MSKKELDIKSMLDPTKLLEILDKLRGYSLIAFIALVVVLYGFIVLRIGTLSSAEPSETAISSHVQAAKVLHIDQTVVDQLQSLQDNSVSVKSLFNEARGNPFQE